MVTRNGSTPKTSVSETDRPQRCYEVTKDRFLKRKVMHAPWLRIAEAVLLPAKSLSGKTTLPVPLFRFWNRLVPILERDGEREKTRCSQVVLRM